MAEPERAPDPEPRAEQPAPVPMSDEARQRRICEIEAEIANLEARQHNAKLLALGSAQPGQAPALWQPPHWSEKPF